ncbi:MAG: hypothetical protein JNG85_16325 [Spirochaetaceae bacterium]|nr:hypothetical protein [Spirochaetaceae bacterium]
MAGQGAPGAGAKELLLTARRLAVRRRPPEPRGFAALVAAALAVLGSEPPELRPRDTAGLPGGLLDLPDLPTVLVPDLHTRVDFLAGLLAWRPPLGAERTGGLGAAKAGPRLAELLERGEACLLCLGDAFHSEGAGAERRWRSAHVEYQSGWAARRVMDGEMGRALACVELILDAKLAFPRRFHYLKGNHDNIANERGRGDHPFYKYAEEGAMASSWFEEFYGPELKAAYRDLELSLPLLARGGRFLASHAEPAFALGPEAVVEFRRRPEVAEALTWTRNDAAAPDAVEAGLAAFLGDRAAGARWFGGHRPVAGRYALRAGGRFVQFHNPDRRQVVLLLPGVEPDPERDILAP